MPIDWPVATLQAIRRVCRGSGSRHFTRGELIAAELRNIVRDTASAGRTPAQTLSRILQDLRDAGQIEFLGQGNYKLLAAEVPSDRTATSEVVGPSELGKVHNKAPIEHPTPELACDIGDPGPAERALMTVSRIIRDSRIVQQLKAIYEYRCQICSLTIELPRGRGLYCEAHHIRPLGQPHKGGDNLANLIVVCPNHHAMLDFGAMALALKDLQITRHQIDQSNVDYHNLNICNRV